MKFQNNHSRGCRDGRRPTSRKGIFWDVTAQHWGKLLALGGVLLVCALPLLGLRIYEDICILTLQQELSGEELLAQMISLRNTNAILEIPAMVLLFVAVAAVLRPLRQFAWGEIVSVGEELLVGLKQNAGHGALCGVLTALGCASAKIGMNMAAVTQDATSLLFSLPMWLMVLLVPLMGYTLVCICIYNNRFFVNLKIAAALLGKHPFRTLLAAALSTMPAWLAWLFPQFYVRMFGGAVGMVLLVWGLLGWLLFVCGKLDEDVNPTYFPELVGKGIGG